MKVTSYKFLIIGVVVGLLFTFLKSDIHFYMMRGYVTALIAVLVGFSAAWLFVPQKSK